MKEELIVSEISLSKAQLNIVELTNGVLNIEQALANPTTTKVKTAPKKDTPKLPITASLVKKKTVAPIVSEPKSEIQIDLQLIDLSNILLTWKSYSNSKPSVILIKEMKADLVKDKNMLMAKLTSAHQIQSLTIKKVGLPPGDLTFNADLRYDMNQQLLTINESEVNYDVFSATLQGSYAHQKNQMLDVKVDASSNDLEFLSIFIKPAYKSVIF